MAARARAEYEDRVPVGEGPARRLTELVLALWPGDVRHPDPRRAVPLAFEMVAATAGELILFRRGGAGALGLDDDGQGRELTRTVLAYLGADESSTGVDP